MDESLLEELRELGEDPPIPVCTTHNRFLTCGKEKTEGTKCRWSTKKEDRDRVNKYHQS